MVKLMKFQRRRSRRWSSRKMCEAQAGVRRVEPLARYEHPDDTSLVDSGRLCSLFTLAFCSDWLCLVIRATRRARLLFPEP